MRALASLLLVWVAAGSARANLQGVVTITAPGGTGYDAGFAGEHHRGSLPASPQPVTGKERYELPDLPSPVRAEARFTPPGAAAVSCPLVDVPLRAMKPVCDPAFTLRGPKCEARCVPRRGKEAADADPEAAAPTGPPKTDKAAVEAHGAATDADAGKGADAAASAALLQGHGIKDTHRVKIGGLPAGPDKPAGAGGGAGSAPGGSPPPQADGPVTEAPLNPDGKVMLGGTPQNFRTPEAQAAAAVASGASRWRMGDFRGVVEETNRALAAVPNDPDALMMQAQAYERLRDFADAEGDLRRSVAVSSSDAKAWAHLAWTQLKQRKAQDALDSASTAVALDPYNAPGFAFKAYAEELLGKKDEALADIQRAAELDKSFSPFADAAARGETMFDPRDGLAGEHPPKRRGRFPPWLPWAGGAAAAGLAISTLAVVLLKPAAPPPAPEPEAPVEQPPLGGKYRLQAGGARPPAGETREGVESSTSRPVVARCLSANAAALDPKAAETLLAEARAVAALRHPALAEALEVVEEPPAVYLVSEAVRGRTLQALLLEKKKLDLVTAAAVLKPVCEALAAAHDQSLAHRDLRPFNIVLADGGSVKLTGFGVGRVAGSPIYRAPEAQFGKHSKEGDVYAAGVCLYEMLTGAPPFPPGASLTDRMEKRYPAASSLVPGLSPAVDELIGAALEPDPAKRLASAADFARGLDAALTPRPAV